jgi:lipopolysaccharide biosynthesis regulator YciM
VNLGRCIFHSLALRLSEKQDLLTNDFLILEHFMDFDFNTLSETIKFVGHAGTNARDLANGMGALKALFQKSEAAADTDIKLALSELTSQVADAKLANAELKAMLQKLKEELAEHQAFKSDLERYELWETPAGAIVYRLRQSAQRKDPMHYLCPNCIESKRHSILNGHDHYRECPHCSTGYQFQRITPPQMPSGTKWR